MRTIRVVRDADAFPREHARDGPGRAADLDSRATQTLEGFDAGAVHEADARQIEAHCGTGSKKIGAFALQQGGPLRDDPALELESRPGSRSLLARDPKRHWLAHSTALDSGFLPARAEGRKRSESEGRPSGRVMSWTAFRDRLALTHLSSTSTITCARAS